MRAHHHVHARGDHGRGVNQRADRSGAFHRVRQPDVQRKLRGFSRRADKQEQGNRREHSRLSNGFRGHRRRARQHGREIQRAEGPQDQKHAEDESEIADAVHPERLVAGVGGGLLQEEETDQQVAAQAHAFPADKHQQVVGREHQQQHEKHEQIQVRKKTAVAGIVVHVSGRVNVNQPAHAGDDQQHDHGELVHLQREVRAESAGGDPREVGLGPGNLVRRKGQKFAHHFERREKRQRRRGKRDARHHAF